MTRALTPCVLHNFTVIIHTTAASTLASTSDMRSVYMTTLTLLTLRLMIEQVHLKQHMALLGVIDTNS